MNYGSYNYFDAIFHTLSLLKITILTQKIKEYLNKNQNKDSEIRKIKTS